MSDVLAVRDEYRAQNWAMVIQECSSSGLSNREFCRQRGVSEKSFYYWQSKLRQQIIETGAPQLVQLETVPASDDMLQIQYRGAELKLPAGVDTDFGAAVPEFAHANISSKTGFACFSRSPYLSSAVLSAISCSIPNRRLQ